MRPTDPIHRVPWPSRNVSHLRRGPDVAMVGAVKASAAKYFAHPSYWYALVLCITAVAFNLLSRTGEPLPPLRGYLVHSYVISQV